MCRFRFALDDLFPLLMVVAFIKSLIDENGFHSLLAISLIILHEVIKIRKNLSENKLT